MPRPAEPADDEEDHDRAGEDELSARLDFARAVSRRAERRLVALGDAGGIDPEHLLPWANRLSDVLFVLSRAVKPGARPAREE